jgi:hypothetical protein
LREPLVGQSSAALAAAVANFLVAAGRAWMLSGSG